MKFRGKTIADVLEMSVDAALELFASVPKIRKVLQTLHDVGLGYVPLGQAAPTLSGGEAQRVKLAAELARPDTGKTLYILDEPTTGLHLDDIRKLLDVVHRLADLGNTVVVIEHNLEVDQDRRLADRHGPRGGARRRRDRRGRARPRRSRRERGASPARSSRACSPPARAPSARGSTPRPRPGRRSSEVKKAARADKAIGPEVKPPWELDGRRWHTRDRVARNGKAARWDGRILEQRRRPHPPALGDFAETDWSQRSVVKIKGGRERLPDVLHRDDRPRVGRHPPVHRAAEHLQAGDARRVCSGSRRSTKARSPCSATPRA